MNRKQRRASGLQAGGRKAAEIRAALAQALEHHRAARFEPALALYRRVLAWDPAHADAQHLVGVVHAQRGEFEAAAEAIGRAVALNGVSAEARNSLGNALRSLGRLAEATDSFRAAIALKPAYAEPYSNLGLTLADLGRGDEAIEAYRAALALAGDPAPIHYNLGLSLQAAGRLDEAAEAYRQAIAGDGGAVDAHNNLGNTLREMGRLVEAIGAYRRAVSLDPGHVGALNNLGVALREVGRPEEAAAAGRAAVALKPDYAEAHSNLGCALKDLGDYDGALAAFAEALRLKPDYADAAVNMAIARQELGDGREALAAVGLALQLDPASTRAWFIGSDLKRFSPGDPDIERMEALLARVRDGPDSLEHRLNLRFALGKAWMDLGEADPAFAHFDAANRLKRAALTYDADADAAISARTRAVFTPERFASLSGGGHPSDAPVFVVGMPRSGTSLVEQILASHSAVHGAGELTAWEDAVIAAAAEPVAFPEFAAGLERADLRALSQAYLDRLPGPKAGKRRIVDKMPGNFRFAGLIALALPNARIIHCRRDPVDTCLSCYSKKFVQGHEYAYDLVELGRYHNAYAALTAHWRRLAPPQRWLEVGYEDLVSDLEGQARRMIEFCGLEWDAACLEFHKTRRPVLTASANQVRQPLYATAVGRWRPYARHLGPLLETLALKPAAATD